MVRIQKLTAAFAIDFRSLALFRIAVGLVWLLDLAYRFLDAGAFYSDAGILPLAAAKAQFPLTTFSTLWMWGGSLLFARLFLGVCMVVAALFAAGVAPRLTAPLNWLLCIALQSRNEMILCGADHMIRELFFFSMFLPVAERFSPVRRRYSGSSGIFSLWTAGLLLQITCFYFFSAILKSAPEWRTDGTALYYVFRYAPFATPLSAFLLSFPALLKSMSFLTLALEALSPLILLATRGRWRTLGFCLFFLFHVGIALTIRLGPIPFLNMAALFVFLPPSFWRSAENIHVCRAPLSAAAGAATIAYVLTWNVAPFFGSRDDAAWKLPGYTLRLDQQWGFFAPKPFTSSGWWAFPARAGDGSPADGWTGGPPSEGRPESYFGRYGGTHWIAYLILSLDPAAKPNHQLLLAYLCRKTPGLAEISFEFEEELTTPPGVPPTRSRYLLANLACERR